MHAAELRLKQAALSEVRYDSTEEDWQHIRRLYAGGWAGRPAGQGLVAGTG